MVRIRQVLRRRWMLIRSYIGWEDYIAFTLIILGAIGYFEGSIPFIAHLTDFYMDNRSSLISIGITVLIIDNVNEMYRRRAEKERLILQMGSPNNSFAIEAVRLLICRRWLFDGSLRRAYLIKANLTGAELDYADLSGAILTEVNLSGVILELAKLSGAKLFGADLTGANLSSADLSGANLGSANLTEADLSSADLSSADLSGANLGYAKLSGANLSRATVTEWQLSEAESLKGAIMPDGNVYNPAIHTEIARLRKEAGLDLVMEQTNQGAPSKDIFVQDNGSGG